MTDFDKTRATYASDWERHGYRLETTEDGRPIVEGDTGQFYCDAVANDCGAALLMEHLRINNSEEYARYREDALDDAINLDKSQDGFVHNIWTYD